MRSFYSYYEQQLLLLKWRMGHLTSVVNVGYLHLCLQI